MQKISYAGYRFPPEVIHQAIWLYLRFTLSFRDVEDLLVERGIMVSYETARRWVNHFGPIVAADLRKRRPKPHSTWHLDEVYLKIGGRMVYLWRTGSASAGPLRPRFFFAAARRSFCHLGPDNSTKTTFSQIGVCRLRSPVPFTRSGLV
jgi:transposase-like protein